VAISKTEYRTLFSDPSVPLLLLLTGSFFLTMFFRTSAAVVLPLEAERLGMSASLTGFISSVHLYAYALLQPVSGILHDRYGPVRVVICGLLLTTLSCLLLTFVRTPVTLGAWRLLSGFGLAPMYSGTLVFLAFAFPPERYCFYAGINFALSSLGAIVSVAPLGFVLDVFGISVTFALLSGTSLFMAAMLGRKAADDPIRAISMKDTRTFSSILPGIAGAFSYIGRNPRLRALMFLWAASSASLLAFQGLWGVAWFSAAFEASPASARFWSSLVSVGLMCGPLLAGRVVLSPENLPLIVRRVSIVNALTWFLLLGTTVAGLPVWTGGIAAFCVGVASGLRVVFSLAGITALTRKGEKGVVFGAMNLIAVFTGVVFQWGSGFVIDFFPGALPGTYSAQGYFAAFLAVAFMMTTSLSALPMLGRAPLNQSEE
jgi:MFS family permease